MGAPVPGSRVFCDRAGFLIQDIGAYIRWEACRAGMVKLKSETAPVAQLDRASDYGSEGWGFDSLRGRHFFLDVARAPSPAKSRRSHSLPRQQPRAQKRCGAAEAYLLVIPWERSDEESAVCRGQKKTDFSLSFRNDKLSGSSRTRRAITRQQLEAAPLCVLGVALVLLNHAVFDIDHAVSVFGDVVLVGHQHDRIALRLQSVEQRHDVIAGLRV